MFEVQRSGWSAEYGIPFVPERLCTYPRVTIQCHRLKKLCQYFQSLAVENKSLKARNSHLERTIICAEVRFGEFAMKQFQTGKSLEQGAVVHEQQAAEHSSSPVQTSGSHTDASHPGPSGSGEPRSSPEVVLKDKQTQVTHHRLLGEAEPLAAGVSRQYFDLVIRELSRTKKYLRDLQKERGVDLQEEWKLGKTLQRCQDLEKENVQLQSDLRELRSLLSDPSDDAVAHRLLALQDQLAALEREREEREASFGHLQKQLGFFQQLCRALMSQHRSPHTLHGPLGMGSDVFRDASTSTEKDEGDDQVFADTPVTKDHPVMSNMERKKDSGVAGSLDTTASMSHPPVHSTTAQQTSVVDSGVQTGLLPAVTRRHLESCAETASQTERWEDKELLELRERVEHLTASRKELSEWNENLQRLYQGTLESLRQVDNSQRLQSLQQTVHKLESQASVDQAAVQQLHLQVDRLKRQLGSEQEERQKAEELLAREMSRSHQQEVNMREKVQSLQNQVSELTKEKHTIMTQLMTGKVATVPPLLQSFPPSHMPPKQLDTLDKPWKMQLQTSSFPVSQPLYQALNPGDLAFPEKLGNPDKISTELESPPPLGMSERICSHCLRSDFSDDNSFISHMQKCLD